MVKYEVKPYSGHWAVFENGKPAIHADTKEEAMRELSELESKNSKASDSGRLLQKAIDSVTDPKTEAEWKEHDAGVRKVMQETDKILDNARSAVKKLHAVENKLKRFKWAGNQQAYIQQAIAKLENGIYGAEDAIERAMRDLS